MAELLTPGVFIQEVDFGPNPIEGVSTSTAGFVGDTDFGPTEGPPVLVTSFADFVRKFGSFVSGKVLAYAVRGFFDNGGKRAYVSRVVGTGNQAALVQTNAGYEVALVAPEPAHTAATFTIRVASVVGVASAIVDNAEIIDKADTTSFPLTVNSINATTGTLNVTGTIPDISPATHAIRFSPRDTAQDRVLFTAANPGAFGNRLQVLLTPTYLASTTITGITSPTVFAVSSIDIFAVGQIVEFDAPVTGFSTNREYVEVTAVDVPTKKITVTPGPTGFAIGNFVRVTGYRLDVLLDGVVVETINGISSDNDDPTNGLEQRLLTSPWVRATITALAIEEADFTTAGNFALFPAGEPVFLETGADGTVDATAIIGVDTVPRTGLKAIEAQQGVNIIAAPGQTDDAVVDELIGQAERRQDRFAVFESRDQPNVGDVLAQRGAFNTRYAAMYHPWVLVRDPLTGLDISMAPSGHVIGAYARTDNERGVFKAPANVTLRNITGFTRNVPDGEQDILNPNGVNVLRRFEGLGNVIWGARTISAEGLWKYVPVRRLFIFIEQSLVRGTRFAVFEPNDLKLWARLKDAVTNFLTTQWRAGALFGAKPEEAFFVKVDETTTTEDDRQNGRVNIVVGIAPVRPAEFIVFLIGQAPQSVIIAEQG